MFWKRDIRSKRKSLDSIADSLEQLKKQHAVLNDILADSVQTQRAMLSHAEECRTAMDQTAAESQNKAVEIMKPLMMVLAARALPKEDGHVPEIPEGS